MLFMCTLESQRPMMTDVLSGLRAGEVAYCVAQVLDRAGLILESTPLRTSFPIPTLQRIERVVCDPRFQRQVYQIGLALVNQMPDSTWDITYDVRADRLVFAYLGKW